MSHCSSKCPPHLASPFKLQAATRVCAVDPARIHVFFFRSFLQKSPKHKYVLHICPGKLISFDQFLSIVFPRN